MLNSIMRTETREAEHMPVMEKHHYYTVVPVLNEAAHQEDI
jgi:hypothetical protein